MRWISDIGIFLGYILFNVSMEILAFIMGTKWNEGYMSEDEIIKFERDQ